LDHTILNGIDEELLRFRRDPKDPEIYIEIQVTYCDMASGKIGLQRAPTRSGHLLVAKLV
jgi:hypothetical protein